MSEQSMTIHAPEPKLPAYITPTMAMLVLPSLLFLLAMPSLINAALVAAVVGWAILDRFQARKEISEEHEALMKAIKEQVLLHMRGGVQPATRVPREPGTVTSLAEFRELKKNDKDPVH